MILVTHAWDGEMEERHRNEIEEETPRSSLFWINSQLEKRKLEHFAYYNHTQRYLDTVTLFENIYELKSEPYDGTTIRLEEAKGFLL
jgi:hypothetical protein